MEAYELLLKARVFLNRRGPAIVNAIPLFEKAIALDPNLADAHAGLGDTYRLFGIYSLMPTREAMQLARTSLERALAIDPDQVEALATLANITSMFDWNYAESRALTERALRKDPSHVRALAEIVTDGENGLLHTKGDAASLERVLRRLLDDRELRDRLGAQAREWVVRERDWRSLAERVTVIYEELGQKQTLARASIGTTGT